jgi:membrane fusion protein, copper/silver efflux system
MIRNPMIRILAVVLVVVSVAALWTWFYPSRGKESSTIPGMVAKNERKVLYWHDPMVPGFKSEKPGKSPFMDMQLVPVYEDEAGGEGGAPVVSIRSEQINNLGVRTYKLLREARPRRLTTEGYLFRDETTGGLNVLVDIFGRDIDWVRAGQPAEVRVLNLGGRRWKATVQSVGSDIDIGARSIKARVRLKQPDPALSPNMFAEVTIEAPPAGKKLFVPREALIRTGTRTTVVLAHGKGRFQPVEVVAGEEYGDWVEIVKGVNDGDTVVTSGQFLIDSESNLRASFQRMEKVPETSGSKEPQ